MSKVNSKVPLKNYIILVVMIVVTVILTLYISSWIKAYKEKELSVSPFSEVVEEVNLSELDLALSETNEIIIYVGYTNDKKIYDMENRLLKYIKDRDIVDKFIYINVTDQLENKEYIRSLKKIFSNVSDNIKEAPMLIYVKNGVAEKVVNSRDGLLHTYDVSTLNESYGLE